MKRKLLILSGLILAFVWLVATVTVVPEKRVCIKSPCVWVRAAETAKERQRGLSGKWWMGEGIGMMFVFDRPGSYGFWMKGMRFPLDFVWIEDGVVVDVTRNVPVDGEIYYPKEPVDMMLEVNSGWVDRHGVEIGDKLVVQ